LADYQAKLAEFKTRDISVIALSVDPLEKAREIVEESKLEFPLAYGLKVPEDAERVGAWWDDKRPMIQPSEFILSNSGKVLSATYSTGPIGRLNADDVLRLLQFIDSRRKPGS
jgi:peroxiredoxin